jgi:hypothetical protein
MATDHRGNRGSNRESGVVLAGAGSVEGVRPPIEQLSGSSVAAESLVNMHPRAVGIWRSRRRQLSELGGYPCGHGQKPSYGAQPSAKSHVQSVSWLLMHIISN